MCQRLPAPISLRSWRCHQILVLTFSDLQADIAADLLRQGVTVIGFNQRDIAGILTMIRTLGALVGAAARAEQLATDYERRLAQIRAASVSRVRPKVYFEEWDAPLISGIGWVSELITIAGGVDVFAELAGRTVGKAENCAAGGGGSESAGCDSCFLVWQESAAGEDRCS